MQKAVKGEHTPFAVGVRTQDEDRVFDTDNDDLVHAKGGNWPRSAATIRPGQLERQQRAPLGREAPASRVVPHLVPAITLKAL